MRPENKKWWLVAFLWCLLIAIATRQPFFTGDSTEQLLVNPYFDSAILNYLMRKAVHIVSFGLLAVLFWLALRGSRHAFLIAWGLATAYGAVDEWHQSFLPERSALVTDVLIDSFGAVVFLVVVYFVTRRRHTQER